MESRVLIQQFGADDFELYYQLVSDEQVMAMITGKAMSRNEALEAFEATLVMNKKDPILGKYKVFDALSREYIGSAKLELDVQQHKQAELGYMLLPSCWGKGYGGALAQALVEIARRHGGLKSLYAMTDPNNVASGKILTARGFTLDRLGEYKGMPSKFFSMRLD
ncbi:MAG: GNAT family N-acetyltransferase [Reichenbachiella sp.]|uniref:GNAT family N-acetyltransferase n=1 Tax=Reichenbachiella sp. TaxID=2184521 RepID=UPI0032678FD0